jgi:hypothetical protein
MLLIWDPLSQLEVALGYLGEGVVSACTWGGPGGSSLTSTIIESAGARQALKLQIQSGQCGQVLPR